MAHSTFAERLGYGRWLRHLIEGEAPSHAEVGRAVDRTGQAVSGWALLEAPPSDYRVHAPLAEYLGVEERWLIRNEGPPPRPVLWREWLVARALDTVRAADPQGVAGPLEKERARATPATARGGVKKAAGAGKGRSPRR